MLRNTPKHLMSFCTASYKPSALSNRAEPTIQPTCGRPHIAQGTGWLPGPLTQDDIARIPLYDPKDEEAKEKYKAAARRLKMFG